MQHPDEGMINTWLDGELSSEEASAIETHLAECPECSAMVAEARGLIAGASRIVSALDMVPAGVIPVVTPHRRRWYVSPQFRAAAAVAIVAGASLLVMNGREKTSIGSIMTTKAPVALEPAPQNPVERDVAAVPQAPAPSPSRPPSTSSPVAQTVPPKADAATTGAAKPLAGRIAGVRPETNAFEVKIDSQERRLRAPVAQDEARKGLLGGVARGVEGGSSFPEYRKVRTDSTESGTRTVFELSPGVQVTLFDATPTPANAQAMRQKSGTAKMSVPATAAPPTAAPEASRPDTVQSVPINTISWTDKRGHLMTLSGRVSTLQLELLRQQLPQDQR